MINTETREQTYNGWTNYETWNVKLWLDNDEYCQSLQREWLDQAQRDAKRVCGGDMKYILSKLIRDIIRDTDNGFIPDLGASMAADLLGAALDNVNWVEIAGSIINDNC